MPAVGVRVALYRLDVGAAPIRMTQALTDADGRVRDLLERPLTAGEYRLEFDVAHEDGSFFTKVAIDLRITDPSAELPRSAAARALFDDDVPGVVTGFSAPRRTRRGRRGDGRPCRPRRP